MSADRFGRRFTPSAGLHLAVAMGVLVVRLASAQPSEIARRADGTPIVTAGNMHAVDYAEELRSLAVRAQGHPEEGAGEAGWEAFVRAGSALQSASRDFHRARSLDARVDGIDFDELYAPTPGADEAETARLEAKRRHTREFLECESAREVDALLDTLATHERAVRWKLGGEAHRAYAAATGMVIPDGPQPLMMLPMVEIGAARALARFCAARIEVAGEGEDWNQVVRWARNGWAVARVLRSDLHLEPRMAGNGTLSLIGTRIVRLVGRKLVHVETLEALAQAERSMLGEGAAVATILESERLLMLQACASVFAADGSIDEAGVERLFEKDAASIKVALAAWPDAEFVLSKANEVFDDYQRFVALVPGRRDPARLIIERMQEHTDVRAMLVQVLAPAIQKAISSDANADAVRAGLRAVISIERFDRLRGRMPDSWEEVRQADIECEVSEPFSGEAVRFAGRGNEGGYIVYSVGLDGRDDGGIEDIKQPRRAIEWGAEPGLDYVIAEVRRDRAPKQ